MKLCFDFGPDETAPLLGDVVILTLMTSDGRLTLASEADVRLALMAELKASLSARYSEECRAGTWVGERAADAWLESTIVSAVRVLFSGPIESRKASGLP